MSNPYVGEVRLIAFTYAPIGWNFCDGSVLSIASYEALFSLIGTFYGGNGQTTFGLPDLRGRVPVHQGTLQGGSTYVIGQISGVESVTLNVNQIPAHNHQFQCNSSLTGATATPANNTVAGGPTVYRAGTPADAMNTGVLSKSGGSQPHENRQPSLAMNWIISLNGVYPSQG